MSAVICQLCGEHVDQGLWPLHQADHATGKRETLPVIEAFERGMADTPETALIELVCEVLPYARSRAEQCARDLDCVMCNGHPGECYLTAWLFDADRRRELRHARGLDNERFELPLFTATLWGEVKP